MGELDSLQNKVNNKHIVLEQGQEREFFKLLKIGVYKELHKKGLITDMELSNLQ